MRGLTVSLVLGLLVLALGGACAGRPRARPAVWAPLAAAPGKAPLIDQGELVLQGQPVQSRATYTAPVRVTCRVELEEATGPDVAFSLLLVPEEGDPVVIRVPWGEARPFQLQAGQTYKLGFRIAPRAEVTVNDLSIPAIDLSLPDGPFHLTLVGEPATSRWRVRSILIE